MTVVDVLHQNEAAVRPGNLQRIHQTCVRKRIFFTERAALQCRLRVNKIFQKKMRVYPCDFCHYWHLTSRVFPSQQI